MIALGLQTLSKGLRCVQLFMGTHLRATGCHLPYGITQRYLPPDTSERAPPDRPVLDLPGTHPGGMQGWVDLGSLIEAWLGIEPTTAWSQVRCPKPPSHPKTLLFCYSSSRQRTWGQGTWNKPDSGAGWHQKRCHIQPNTRLLSNIPRPVQIAIHQMKISRLTLMAFYQAFIGLITSPPAHVVTEGRRQPNIYFWEAERQ